MDVQAYDCGALPASVRISRFKGVSGVEEYHLTVRPTEYGSTDAQLGSAFSAYRGALDSLGLSMHTAVLRRFFCSDLVNQATALETHPFSNPRNAADPCAVSWVCEPPVPPAKVALWAYHMKDPTGQLDKIQEATSLTLRRGELSHHWTTGLTCPIAGTSYEQTRGIFEEYNTFLRAQELTLADHVIRTWLFVQNIDANYQGLVAARREFFTEHGLTPQTHFIASTGVEGSHADIAAKVTMDAYAISGVRPEQIEFLAALDHLSATHVYGVTFERATAVSYRDRRHVILSGTASIDHQGNILYPGDMPRQLDRTLENVEALLAKAGATLKDMGVFIVYVRSPSDCTPARQKMQERFGDVPLEVVVAHVCRPGWLIEVEGLATIPADNPNLPPF